MTFEIWHIWMIAFIIFMILEIFIPSFLMASIGLGCLFSFLGSLVAAPTSIQVVLFIIGTLTGLVGIKPFMKRYMYNQKSVKTNYTGLVGRTGKVLEKIDSEFDTGCVAIDGDQWKAIAENNQTIEIGTKVLVTKLESIVLTVTPIKNIINNQGNVPSEEKINSNNTLVVGVGTKKHLLNFSEIVCFYSTEKTTFIVTENEKEFIYDDSLEKLSMMIPEDRFFRANRQFILSRDIIASYKSDINGKINLKLKSCNDLPENIKVSRLKAHAFRSWIID